MHATRSYIEAFVSALSERTNIKFIEGSGFGVDLLHKTFRYDPLILKNASIDEVKGILIHEVGHLKYTTIVSKSPLSKKYPCLSALYNIFEDLRIEHLMIREFDEFALYPIEGARMYACESNYYSLQAEEIKPSPFYAFAFGMSSLFMYYDAYPLTNLGSKISFPYHSYITRYVSAYMRILTDKQDKKGKLIRDYLIFNTSDLIKKIDNCRSTKEVFNLVDEEIVPHIIDLLEEETERGERSEALHGMIKEFVENVFKTSGNLLGDLIKGSETGRFTGNPQLMSDNEIKKLYSISAWILEKHFRSILQEKRTVKYTGAYKRGKLLPRNIFKVKTHEKRLYSKRINPDTPFYEITFVVDESGSMSERTRYNDVYIAAFVINMACEKLGFKINYIGFDDDVYTYKHISKMREFHQGGNDESKVLKHVEKIIDPENDNIVFLLTDGGVAESRSPKPMMEKFKKQGVHVIPIGVGIEKYQAEEFKRWYPDSVLAKDMDDLVRVMGNYLKQIIFR